MASTISAGLTTTTSLSFSGDTSGVLQLQTNGTTTAVTIDTSQNVGIGTSTMTRNLNVGGSGAGVGLSLQNSGTSGRSYSIFSTNTSASVVGALGIYDDTAGAYRMIIDSSGNLGLGVTPSAWGGTGLQVGAHTNIYSYGANSGFTYNCYINSSGSVIYSGSGYATAYQQTGGAHQFYTAPSGTAGNAVTLTQAMTLDNSGRLLIGITSVYNGTCTIQQKNSIDGNQVVSFANSSTNTPYIAYFTFSNAAPNNATSDFLECSDNAANRILLHSNGGIANYSANNVNLSDQTMKKDIAPAKSYLSILNQIPVVTFLLNDQTDNELNLGVTAQSVQAVAPELVGTMNVGTKDSPNIKLAIYETDLKYAMLKAIQELSAQVTTLQSQVAALKA
jgi:Chaperone of endosialidase